MRDIPVPVMILASADGKRRVCIYKSPEDTFFYDYECESAEDPRDPGFTHAGRHQLEEKLPVAEAIVKIKEKASEWLSASNSVKESDHLPTHGPIVWIFFFSSLVIVSSEILLVVNLTHSSLIIKEWFWWCILFIGFGGLLLVKNKRVGPNKSFQRTLPSGQRR